MKLLVTGNSGQLAQSLSELNRPGVAMVCVGRPAFNLADRDCVRRAIDREEPDVVINTAAYTAVDKAEQEPEEAMRINADGAKHVAEACAAADRPLIHISTDYVFDGRKDDPYIETDSPNPINAYGRSKLAGEEAVAEACDQHLILRTTWIYSPFGTNFLKTILRLAGEREELSIVNDQIGAPTYAADLAEAILTISRRISNDKNSPQWGLYHLTAQGEAPWSGFAGEILRVASPSGAHAVKVIPIPSSSYPTPAARPKNSRLNCDKFEAAFGLRLPHWQNAIARCMHRIASHKIEGF